LRISSLINIFILLITALKKPRRSHRRLARNSLQLAGCLGALATSGCASMSEQYFREGVGVTLNSGQLAQATQLQDEYVYYICRQAGGFKEGTAAGPSCTGSDWTTFTVAGMNDIDQRCDAYLDWLDAQRRDRTPVLAQIAAMGAATAGIMGVAGAGTEAIAIAATAFGLAGQSYANWNSRLLLDVDHSTVQAVVYSRQQQYRQSIYTISVPNRASAIYLLRQYLRLCMPITIETEINTTATLFAKGVPETAVEPLVRAVAAQPLRAAAPVTTPPIVRRVWAPGWKAVSPDTIVNVATAQAIQGALCLKPTADGSFNAPTQVGLQIYLSWDLAGGSEDESKWRNRQVRLTGHDIENLRQSTCAPNAKNFLESSLLGTERGLSVAKKVMGKFGLTGAKDIPALRPQIAEWKRELGLSNGPDDMFENQVTPGFLNKIRHVQGND
jgi:hypothetical protein